MKRLQNVIYGFIFMLCSSCFNNVEKQLNTWNQRLCCPLKDIMVKTIKYKNTDGITVSFCQQLNTELSLSLIKKNREGAYNDFFSLRSQGMSNLTKIQFGKNLPKGFLGEYLSTISLPNGAYRLHLATHSSCGEILFSIEKEGIKDIKYSCIFECE